jgi:hypothetical protein
MALTDILKKPFVQKIEAQLWEDLVPRIRAKIGEEPAIALGGLATFLTWLVGKLPANIAAPARRVVAVLGVLSVRATVTPAAAPKVVVTAPIPGAAPIVVKVPAVTPPAEHVQTAIQDAVAKAAAALKGAVTHGTR